MIIATLDEDGFLQITDRLSRFSKIGGEAGLDGALIYGGHVERSMSATLRPVAG